MDDKALQFDRKKHILYSKQVKQVILKHLSAHYPEKEAARIWENVQKTYVKILENIPYMGGKRNGQAGSVYDCAALFAYYEAVPEKPDLREMGEMNNELFLPQMTRAGFANLNRSLDMKAAKCIYRFLSKAIKKHEQDWPGNYKMEVCPSEEGTKYLFTRCPIAELAKKLGYTQLMPAMCNPDYPMLKVMHGGLIRTTTCAFGDYCDFWIVGDQSDLLRKYPQKQNEAGFLYNEAKETEKSTD